MKRIALKQSLVPLFLNGATALRVVVKLQPEYVSGDIIPWRWPDCCGGIQTWAESELYDVLAWHCPYPVGSLVALTETWATDCLYDALSPRDLPHDCVICYAVTMPASWYGRRRSPITMPAEFSRFHRRVAEVRVEHGEQWEWVLTLEEVKHG
jgi:hypothetical protein